MGILDMLGFSNEVTVENKGEYVIIYISGLPYHVPIEIYEKMKKNK